MFESSRSRELSRLARVRNKSNVPTSRGQLKNSLKTPLSIREVVDICFSCTVALSMAL